MDVNAFDRFLGKINLNILDALREHGPLNETQKRNFLREIGQTFNPMWPFANEGEKLFAEFLDKNAYPYVYADQDLETYSAAFYHKVSRPDFQVFIGEIGATFWVDAKYRTLYKTTDEHHIVPWLTTRGIFHASCDAKHLVGQAFSSVRAPYSEYFTMARSEFTRLMEFRRLSNSQVWVCFINRNESPTIGHFINVEKIWSISYGEDHRPAKDVYSYTARDPIEVPVSRAFLKSVDFSTDTSLSKLFERTEFELKMHRDRVHRRH